jgi:2-dehydropantoate 2-reductase
MRIGVIGSGGVGGYFGAQLAAHGEDVVFLARGEHMAAMRSNGLTILSDLAPVHINGVHVTDSVAGLGRLDLALMTVKLWDTERMAEELAAQLDERSTVISLQNGVTKDDLLRQYLPAERLVGGACYISAAIKSPGVIQHNGLLARIVFGEFGGRLTPRIEQIRDVFLASGIDACASADIEDVLWRKYVFLVGLSALTTATRRPIGVLRENPATRRLLKQTMAEVVAVANARGIDLPATFVDDQLNFIDTLPDEMTSSMLNDLEHGRRLELPWLTESVVHMGAETGVPTPANEFLATILSPYVDGSTRPM